MAGHSHWARIKRAKAVTDARRGRAWSKLARGIIVAARSGGGDPENNLALRCAIDEARAENMPRDTIERAIKKGTGELAGEALEELVYEGYGPGGVAILCAALTDNRARTAGEIKKIFELHAGNLGATNCVAWMFSKRGVFSIPPGGADEERLMQIALETGADDVKRVAEYFEITCEPGVFEPVRARLKSAGIQAETAEISMVASTNTALAGETAQRAMKLIEALEEHDDIQHVYSNLEVSDAEMVRLAR
jgi:YebC/PmpR family DNA-binding regulatory protein